MTPTVQKRHWQSTQLGYLFVCCCAAVASGCWAPLVSPAIPASELPDSFRTHLRTHALPLNLSELTLQPPGDYLLGPDDVLDVTIHGIVEGQGEDVRPLRAQVVANGEIHLPLVGAVRVAGLNLVEASDTVTRAYGAGFLQNPRCNVALAEKSTVSVVVLGQVREPGSYNLPKYENDVAHALAAAGGLALEAEGVIEIHRTLSPSLQQVSKSLSAALLRTNLEVSVPPENARAHSKKVKSSSKAETGVRPGDVSEARDAFLEEFENSDVKFPAQSRSARKTERSKTNSHANGKETSGDDDGGRAQFPRRATKWISNLFHSQDEPKSKQTRPRKPNQDRIVGPKPSQEGKSKTDPEELLHDVPRLPIILASTGQVSLHATAISELSSEGGVELMENGAKQIIRIPLRGLAPGTLNIADIELQSGDVIQVPTRRNDVFYVVGNLNTIAFTRFSIGAEDRDLGAGFLLPRDRDIDVVTAVAMAGYIDPIDSPTTVNVHRLCPDGSPIMIRVDLIKARYDRHETILVQPGDIIYLNPDSGWYLRRAFDRMVVGSDFFRILPTLPWWRP